MGLNSLDHYNIETTLPEETIAFYCDALGCTNSPERGPTPSRHLLTSTGRRDSRELRENDRAGDRLDRPRGLDGSDFDGMCEKLTSLGIEFEQRERPRSACSRSTCSTRTSEGRDQHSRRDLDIPGR